MRVFVRSSVLWVGLALMAAFWVAAFLIENGTLLEIMRVLQISVASVVVVAYSPYAIQAVRSGQPDRVGQLSLGISLGFLSVILNGAWFLIWRLSDQPRWMANSDIGGFWIWLSILAAVLHITAPGAVDGIVPRRNWIMLGLAFGAGVLSALVLTVSQPNIAWLAEWLERWLSG